MNPLHLMATVLYWGMLLGGIIVTTFGFFDGNKSHLVTGIRAILSGYLIGLFMPVFEILFLFPIGNITPMQLINMAATKSPYYRIFPGLSGESHLLLVAATIFILTTAIWNILPKLLNPKTADKVNKYAMKPDGEQGKYD